MLEKSRRNDTEPIAANRMGTRRSNDMERRIVIPSLGLLLWSKITAAVVSHLFLELKSL